MPVFFVYPPIALQKIPWKLVWVLFSEAFRKFKNSADELALDLHGQSSIKPLEKLFLPSWHFKRGKGNSRIGKWPQKSHQLAETAKASAIFLLPARELDFFKMHFCLKVLFTYSQIADYYLFPFFSTCKNIQLKFASQTTLSSFWAPIFFMLRKQ